MYAVCMFYNLGHFRNLDRNLQMAQQQHKDKSFSIKACLKPFSMIDIL